MTYIQFLPKIIGEVDRWGKEEVNWSTRNLLFLDGMFVIICVVAMINFKTNAVFLRFLIIATVIAVGNTKDMTKNFLENELFGFFLFIK